MLNLNRYRDREAYYRYAAVATTVLERVGGKVLWHAQAQGTVIGDQSDVYDEVIAVWYPSAAAFIALTDGSRAARGPRRSRRRARAGRADPLRGIRRAESSTDPEPGGRRVLAAAVDLRGRRPAALGLGAPASPGWGSPPASGSRSRRSATPSPPTRSCGASPASSTRCATRCPSAGRSRRRSRPGWSGSTRRRSPSPPRRRGCPAAPTGRAGSPPTPAATCTWSSAAGRTG